MAILRIPKDERTVKETEEIAKYLSGLGIQYEVWVPEGNVARNSTAESILAAYSGAIERLKSQGNYVTADVIDVHRDTPGLDAMLAKFDREHWHDEDEVRFIIDGSGVFHIRPATGPVVAIEVEAGDLVRVPRGTMHWFNLCPDRRIRAIRLFQDPSGWTPHYSETGIDRNFEAVCFGPAFLEARK